MPIITLPTLEGTLEAYETGEAPALRSRPEPGEDAVVPRTSTRTSTSTFTRKVYAAAHVVADPLAAGDPTSTSALDWEATLAYRRHLWGLGLGVAEAMDTAQRGAGLDFATSRELIRRTVEASADVGPEMLVCGAGTDHLPADPSGLTLDDVVAAYEEQIGFVEGLGGRAVMMASRALAAVATSADDYRRVYDRVLVQVSRPAIVHWLGEMFDPALRGYFGSRDPLEAMEVCLEIVGARPDKVAGVKVSLLDASLEIAMRRRLPPGVRMFTGDDFDYVDLIAGDERGHSDALLGILDPIAEPAAAALAALAAGDEAGYRAILEPTQPLARHVFAPPTRHYKTGVVFLAWLNCHQEGFVMVGGHQSSRSLVHLAELFRLADRAGLLRDPDRACRRMRRLLELHGVRG